MTNPREQRLNLKTPAIVRDREVLVSTVKLAGNHGCCGNPLWFETMVFRHNGDDKQVWFETMVLKRNRDSKQGFSDLFIARYATQDEAEKGHAEVVASCNDGTIELCGWDDDDE